MTLPDEETQTLVFTGFGRLNAMRMIVARFKDPSTSLAQLSQAVTFGKPTHHISQALQLGLTPAGLHKLGVSLASLPQEIAEPLASDHHRRVLGDHGRSAPETWLFNGDDADLILLLYAESETHLNTCHEDLLKDVDVLHAVDSVMLDEGREHFGFPDGLSNPHLGEDTPWGEFVLGYPDATGERPPGIAHHGSDIGRDGTYLVIRQLEQDVVGFWDSLRARSDDPIALAQKMIGRSLDGTPLTGSDPISYGQDAHGMACPRGAHIRRANPRDAKPGPEFPAFSQNRHRLLRRGRPYGPPAPPEIYPQNLGVTAQGISPDLNAARGLVFMSLCANVARQFEFVQQSWLNNPKQEGLFDEIDPLSSAERIPGDARRFTIPDKPLRTRLHDWPHVVTVRGSAYAFMPGRAALMELCKT